jgi:hypothetical protein
MQLARHQEFNKMERECQIRRCLQPPEKYAGKKPQAFHGLEKAAVLFPMSGKTA